MRKPRGWNILLSLPFLVLLFATSSQGEELTSKFTRMERDADLIFKGRVMATTENTNNALFPYWAKTHVSRFSLISVLKGTVATNELLFWHVTHPPDAWGGGSPPSDHQFEVGRSYIVFARTMEKADYLYTPP